VSDAAIALQVEDLYKSFGSLEVIKGMSLTARNHEVISVIGSSGSGKSTFLRCLNFLETPDSGRIVVGGEEISVRTDNAGHPRVGDQKQVERLRARLGMVFQGFNLWTHMTVLQNVMEGPLTVLRVPAKEARDRTMALLEKVGIAEKHDAYPSELSGGQQQRVAIARALCMEPQVLLFDEPTSALDPELIGEVVVVMEQLAHEGATMIVVSHEMAFAREAADRVIYLEGGVVVEEGPPEQVLDDPQEEATKQFLRRFLSEGAKAPTADEPNPISPFMGTPGGGTSAHDLGGRSSAGTPTPDPLAGRSGGGGSRHGHGGGG
jgi:octopine/nopaline transport system ATP-binding protein